MKNINFLRSSAIPIHLENPEKREKIKTVFQNVFKGEVQDSNHYSRPEGIEFTRRGPITQLFLHNNTASNRNIHDVKLVVQVGRGSQEFIGEGIMKTKTRKSLFGEKKRSVIFILKDNLGYKITTEVSPNALIPIRQRTRRLLFPKLGI